MKVYVQALYRKGVFQYAHSGEPDPGAVLTAFDGRQLARVEVEAQENFLVHRYECDHAVVVWEVHTPRRLADLLGPSSEQGGSTQ